MMDAKSRCPKCGRELAYKEARFCTSCGASTVRGGPDRKRDVRRVKTASKGAGTGMGELVLEPVDKRSESKPASGPPETAAVDDWEIVSLDPMPPPSREETPPGSVPLGEPRAPATAESASPSPPSGSASAVSSPRIQHPENASSAETPLEDRVTQALTHHGASPTRARGKDNEMANINPPVQEKRTIIEDGTQLNGNLESACPVVVHGCVEGDVQAPSLTVSGSGRVKGTAKVGTIRCDGELAGEFDADHVVLSGAIKDNTVIRAATIEMKLKGKRGKKQIIFGDSEVPEEVESVVDAGAGLSKPPDADKQGETASPKTSEPPAEMGDPLPKALSERPDPGPLGGRASQPPPPAE